MNYSFFYSTLMFSKITFPCSSQKGESMAKDRRDEEGCDESDLDSDRDCGEAPNDPDIRIRQLSVATSRRP